MYDQHIIIDFEMNPVSTVKRKDAHKYISREIVEVGAVKLNDRYEVAGCFERLIKPEYNSEITGYITKLTGIKTPQVMKGEDLKDALKELSTWIGNGKTRVYSWSDSDLVQLRKECAVKEIEIPENMSHWMDFQILFPYIMKIEGRKRMSLKDAADWYGITIDAKSAHRALYDARITADLVQVVLTGEYRKHLNIFREKRDDRSMESTIGARFGSLLSQFVFSNDELPCA